MERGQERTLSGLHDCPFGFVVVVVTNQVQRTMHDQQRQFIVEIMTVSHSVGGNRWADHHITDHWGPVRIEGFWVDRIPSNQLSEVERECENVGRTGLAPYAVH